ncbi:hypothetical protein Tco_0151016 [Tanacetum coccineum]
MRLPQFTKGSKREGFYQSKGGKDNSSSQVHNGREKDVILIGKVKQKITRGLERAQGMGLSSNDWKNGWQRLMGAWVDLKRLEAYGRGSNNGRDLKDFTGLSLDKPELLISSIEHKLLFS